MARIARQCTAPVNIAANNGYSHSATLGIGGIHQFDDRVDKWFPRGVGHWAAGAFRQVIVSTETMCALFYIPAIIASFGHQVNLFVERLACIAHKQLMRSAHVKRKTI